MLRNNNATQGGDDKIALIRAFIETAHRLSFAEAAQALDLTASTLSRRVRRLEYLLGVQLLNRTTRRVTVTEAGEVYLRHVTRLVAELEEADAAVASIGARPTGRLSVSLPSTFGRLRVTPLLPAFMYRYPDIRIDLQFTDHFVDLVDHKIDVAVRIGTLANSSLKARRLMGNRRRLVAAPAYIERCGEPLLPGDLAGHKCLHFSQLLSGEHWLLENNGVTERVAIKPQLSANDAGALFAAACAGNGIALLADFITADAVADGRLRCVLENWSVPDTHVYAVYPHTSYVPAKTRVFVDYLCAALAPGGSANNAAATGNGGERRA